MIASQSRLSSFYEACINIVIGFTINFLMNMLVIPRFATGANGEPAQLSLTANFLMGCLFTVVSLIRSYAIRRWFNARLHAWAVRMAGGAQ